MADLEAKKAVVQKIKEKLQTSPAAVLADYRGLTVAEVTDLRNQLRQAGVEYRVVKNTLAVLAAREAGLPELEEYLKGPTAIAYSGPDPAAPAKILSEFARTHKNLVLQGGVVEGKVIDQAGVRELAELPSREVLLGKTLGAIQAPLAGWVGVLQAPIRQLVYVLDSIRQKKEGGAPAPAAS